MFHCLLFKMTSTRLYAQIVVPEENFAVVMFDRDTSKREGSS
jgi:hypothetical protein